MRLEVLVAVMMKLTVLCVYWWIFTSISSAVKMEAVHFSEI
jgi:hypothetical protein